MKKYFILFFTILIILLVLNIMEVRAEVIVGTPPGVPACQELNDKMEWTVQSYLYHECEEYGVDYMFALAVIEEESHFNVNAYNKHSVDRGLMQVNSQWVSRFKKYGWINGAKDLFDPKTNIKCGMYILGDAVAKYGNTERAYVYYNTGSETIKSNKASREVMKYWKKWEDSFKE